MRVSKNRNMYVFGYQRYYIYMYITISIYIWNWFSIRICRIFGIIGITGFVHCQNVHKSISISIYRSLPLVALILRFWTGVDCSFLPHFFALILWHKGLYKYDAMWFIRSERVEKYVDWPEMLSTLLRFLLNINSAHYE